MHGHRNQNNRVLITEKARKILRVFSVLCLVLDSYYKGVFTLETFVGCTHKISALSYRCYISFKKVFVWCVCVCARLCSLVDVFMPWCMYEGQKTTLDVCPCLLPCLRQGLFWVFSYLHLPFSHRNSGITNM